MDRLREWRERFAGRLYVFENLQLHRTVSCPQPNTSVLLEDLRRFREMGIDGIVYEALDGMAYFEEQIGVLADGLWNPDIEHVPTPVERWCTEHAPSDALFFLKEFGFPFEQLKGEWDEPLRKHIRNVRDFVAERSPGNLRRTIEHMVAHPDRFGRQAASWRFLQMFHGETPFSGLAETERRFLTMNKLWDFMEPLEHPIEAVDEVVGRLMEKL
jgi:hypothetical protein